MGLNITAKNAMLSSLISQAVYASIHNNDPAENGANEISGGSPAYARKSLTWGTPSNGSVSITNQPVFDIPAGTTVKYIGLWSASTGGTFYGSAAVTNETYSGQGTYTVTSGTISIS